MERKYLWLAIGAILLGFAPANNSSLAQKPPIAKVESVTVRDFGAVGDGKSDDSVALQRAVDAKAGRIYLPRGVYRITRSIIIELDRVGPTSIVADGTAKLVMAGAGPALKFVGTHNGTASPKTVKQNVWQRQRMPFVDGLEIVGAHPEAVGIEASYTMQGTFTRVLVRKGLHGIHLTKKNRNVIISNCHIYENRGVGIFLDRVNLHQINVTNCHISYNQGGGIVVLAGDVRNLQIGSCDIEDNLNHEESPTANVLFDVRDGSLRECAIVGCTIQHSHNAPDSANIRLLGRGPEDNKKVGNMSIANNVFSDVSVNIHIRHGRGVVITGNTFWKGYAHDLLVEGSSNIVVGANLLDRNPDYDYRNQPKSSNSLVFRDCVDVTLTGLHVNGTMKTPAGLILEGCRRFNITNCSILNCDGCGILLQNVENVRVTDCLIHDDRPEVKKPVSIRLVKGKNNMIRDNLVNGRIEITPGSLMPGKNY
ncbi:MAG: right-handed parallel beta-helix repeat-containing protein [Sedimentisphaerales bacterium]|nr:right-handed parallel beta-helix repeat-containing protein [Sedimentisphaerales bacterium]